MLCMFSVGRFIVSNSMFCIFSLGRAEEVFGPIPEFSSFVVCAVRASPLAGDYGGKHVTP